MRFVYAITGLKGLHHLGMRVRRTVPADSFNLRCLLRRARPDVI